MKKFILGFLGMAVLLSSCVSQKKYAELETKQKETQDLLNSATVKLNSCEFLTWVQSSGGGCSNTDCRRS